MSDGRYLAPSCVCGHIDQVHTGLRYRRAEDRKLLACNVPGCPCTLFIKDVPHGAAAHSPLPKESL